MNNEFKYLKTEHKVYIHTGSLATRLKRFKANNKKRITGPYYLSQFATSESVSFYYDSDFALDMRNEWADQVVYSIKHTGWYTDEYCSDTIRGIVYRLPKNRGFLAGCSMGEGMASELDRSVYDCEKGAAFAADRMAEIMAEMLAKEEREYQDKSRMVSRAEEIREEMSAIRAEFSELHSELPSNSVGQKTCAVIRGKLEALRGDFSELLSELIEIKTEYSVE